MNRESVKKKIIFDTNVISYISKQNLENELLYTYYTNNYKDITTIGDIIGAFKNSRWNW